MNKLKLAVLISGHGSNLQAIIDACKDKNFPAEIVCVISNKEEAFGLERAKRDNIEHHFIDHTKFNSREAFDAEISKILKQASIDLICLAGFMRILSKEFVTEWANKIINIHPSLLPAFAGTIDAPKKALEAGVKITGCTVHFVTDEVDEGPILIQKHVYISPDDDIHSLTSKIHHIEHAAYIEAIRHFAESKK